MKLPRWLSPVRTVEAETGWPRAVCRGFVLGREMDWLILVWFFWAMLLAIPMLIGLPILMLASGADALNTAALLVLLLGLVASGALVAGLTLTVNEGRAARVRSALPQFLAEPWCLHCHYPLPPPGADICPECGEPIPPEIAALAAERAGG